MSSAFLKVVLASVAVASGMQQDVGSSSSGSDDVSGMQALGRQRMSFFGRHQLTAEAMAEASRGVGLPDDSDEEEFMDVAQVVGGGADNDAEENLALSTADYNETDDANIETNLANHLQDLLVTPRDLQNHTQAASSSSTSAPMAVDDEEEEMCQICYSGADADEGCLVSLCSQDAKHRFHDGCIADFMSKSNGPAGHVMARGYQTECPTCRQAFKLSDRTFLEEQEATQVIETLDRLPQNEDTCTICMEKFSDSKDRLCTRDLCSNEACRAFIHHNCAAQLVGRSMEGSKCPACNAAYQVLNHKVMREHPEVDQRYFKAMMHRADRDARSLRGAEAATMLRELDNVNTAVLPGEHRETGKRLSDLLFTTPDAQQWWDMAYLLTREWIQPTVAPYTNDAEALKQEVRRSYLNNPSIDGALAAQDGGVQRWQFERFARGLAARASVADFTRWVNYMNVKWSQLHEVLQPHIERVDQMMAESEIHRIRLTTLNAQLEITEDEAEQEGDVSHEKLQRFHDTYRNQLVRMLRRIGERVTPIAEEKFRTASMLSFGEMLNVPADVDRIRQDDLPSTADMHDLSSNLAGVLNLQLGRDERELMNYIKSQVIAVRDQYHEYIQRSLIRPLDAQIARLRTAYNKKRLQRMQRATVQAASRGTVQQQQGSSSSGVNRGLLQRRGQQNASSASASRERRANTPSGSSSARRN